MLSASSCTVFLLRKCKLRQLISFFFLSILTTVSITTFAQQVVDVTDQTIKIGGLKEEELYFGFAKGDKVIFNFKEINDKELKEVEIIEYPENSKFSDFKTTTIENKTLNISKQGVYIFRFKNSNVAGRICKIQIQRIPLSNETTDFNTSVKWVTRQDTSWNTYTKDIVVGYDTTYEQRTKRELISTEQREELITDKTQRVHSQTSGNGNKSDLFFTLPTNQITAYETKTVISWAYWVGVGEDANLAWKSNAQSISTLTKGIATYITSPLGALAIGTVTDLMLPKVGEDVGYSIADQRNKDLFIAGYQYNVWDQGKGVAGYKKFTEQGMCQGTFFVCLYNDNIIQAIDVNVKVIAIVERKVFADKKYTEIVVKPRYEKKIYSDPIIRSSEIPITGQ
ncbi:MAG: hypothetical protein JNL95_03910 [Chitinophagales bacterium]|nr:hypothetical protein [Chitinophagales bacterium]